VAVVIICVFLAPLAVHIEGTTFFYRYAPIYTTYHKVEATKYHDNIATLEKNLYGGYEYKVFSPLYREQLAPVVDTSRLGTELIACGFVFAALFLAVGKGGKKTDL
jgi:hypothetical protein